MFAARVVFGATSLLIVSFVGKAYELDYSNPYCNIEKRHILCIKQFLPNVDDGCIKNEIIKRGFTEEEKQDILSYLNQHRAQVANGRSSLDIPPASNMLEMTWNDELELMGQSISELCNVTGFCDKCDEMKDGGTTGSQFHLNFLPSQDGKAPDYPFAEYLVSYPLNDIRTKIEDHVIDKYVYEFFRNDYIELIWAKTTEIGCGILVHKDLSNEYTFYVNCLFSPKGMLMGYPVYKAGQPCSGCPLFSSCSKSYPGLCIMDSKTTPQPTTTTMMTTTPEPITTSTTTTTTPEPSTTTTTTTPEPSTTTTTTTPAPSSTTTATTEIMTESTTTTTTTESTTSAPETTSMEETSLDELTTSETTTSTEISTTTELFTTPVSTTEVKVTLDVTTPDWATLETEDYSTTTTTEKTTTLPPLSSSTDTIFTSTSGSEILSSSVWLIFSTLSFFSISSLNIPDQTCKSC